MFAWRGRDVTSAGQATSHMSDPMTSQPDKPVKVLVLYAEMVGYVLGTLKALLKCEQPVDVEVVHWDKKNINSSRLAITESSAIRFRPRSSLNDAGLLQLLHTCQPDVVLVSGWMDRGYLRAIRAYRNAGAKTQVVCGIDGQWRGTLRQHLGRIFFRLFYARLFDFMWVSGKPQYHYANRLGYGHERIICNIHSADTDLFKRRAAVSKRFVFVGRFDPVKALDQLLEAYLLLPESVQELWPLVLIGDGELKEKILSQNSPHIAVLPFMQPQELMEELMKGGVACIPSHYEQWGVAIHEMALLGFPLVLSSACGAATEFLISGYNGFLFRRSKVASLNTALRKIAGLNDAQLESFAARSHQLGRRINSEQSAYSLLSTFPLADI